MVAITKFDPANWYWKGGDGRVWGSARRGYVTSLDADAAYATFLAAGFSPTAWPKDPDGNEGAAELQAVLAQYGVIGWVQSATGDWIAASAGEQIRLAARAECEGRIYAVAPATTQMNMTAARAAGVMNAADQAAYAAALVWVQDMRAAYRALVAAADADFALDSKWPPVPAAVAELCSRY